MLAKTASPVLGARGAISSPPRTRSSAVGFDSSSDGFRRARGTATWRRGFDQVRIQRTEGRTRVILTIANLESDRNGRIWVEALLLDITGRIAMLVINVGSKAQKEIKQNYLFFLNNPLI